MRFKSNKYIYILVVVIAISIGGIVLFTLYNWNVEEGNSAAIRIEEKDVVSFKYLYDEQHDSEMFIILDIRTHTEQDMFIPGSVSFSPDSLAENNNREKIDGYLYVSVVAEDINQARSFAQLLAKQEWQNEKILYVLDGLIEEWIEKGYPYTSISV